MTVYPTSLLLGRAALISFWLTKSKPDSRPRRGAAERGEYREAAEAAFEKRQTFAHRSALRHC
jgi:hypothetical protein